MFTKKYYLISEVVKILSIPSYKLRYLEKSRDDIIIHKVKSRRYYTQEDIRKLKNHCNIIDEEIQPSPFVVQKDEAKSSELLMKATTDIVESDLGNVSFNYTYVKEELELIQYNFFNTIESSDTLVIQIDNLIQNFNLIRSNLEIHVE